MGFMFQNSSLTNINLSNFNTSKVTDMKQMFYNSKATSINVSSFNTSNVTLMYGMFRNTAVTTLDLSSFNTSNVTSMADMFHGSKLTTLDLSSFDTSKVSGAGMRTMFNYSTALTTIYVSDKFTTNLVTNESNGIFNGCTALKGGAGTVFNSSNVDKTYARIDGGTSSPGYFTAK